MDASDGEILFWCFGLPLIVGAIIAIQHGTGWGVFWGIVVFFSLNYIFQHAG